MDALRSETAVLHNINVTNILPGSVATNISRNALTADGSTRGKSDDTIDAGEDPMDLAAAILKAVTDNQPELIFANEFEMGATKLRH